MNDERPSRGVCTLDRITTVEKHRVPEENVAFPREKLLPLEPFGQPGHPLVITRCRRRRSRAQVRLRVIVELRKPFRSMGSRTVNEGPAVGRNIFTGNPAPEQKITRVDVEHGHVLMQTLAAAAGKGNARSSKRAMLENQ